MSPERVRNWSFAAIFVVLPVFVAVTIFGAVMGGRPPWDALYLAVAALLLTAGTIFTVTAIALAMRHTRQQAASTQARPRPRSFLSALALVALAANLAVIGLSGHVNALNVVLALLVGAFLLLLREHARREGIRDRTR